MTLLFPSLRFASRSLARGCFHAPKVRVYDLVAKNRVAFLILNSPNFEKGTGQNTETCIEAPGHRGCSAAPPPQEPRPTTHKHHSAAIVLCVFVYFAIYLCLGWSAVLTCSDSAFLDRCGVVPSFCITLANSEHDQNSCLGHAHPPAIRSLKTFTRYIYQQILHV
jgi:hypothetical protein